MGGNALLHVIFKEHLGFIVRCLTRAGVHPQDADDVTQEVLVGAHRRSHSFDPGRGTLRAWLAGIAANQASNYRRRAHRRRELLQPAEELDQRPDTRAGEVDWPDPDRLRLLERLLEGVPEPRRRVLIMRELEGVPMVQVAQSLSIKLSTAWSRHRLARDDVRAAARRWKAAHRS